jgi:hypothetical protein
MYSGRHSLIVAVCLSPILAPEYLPVNYFGIEQKQNEASIIEWFRYRREKQTEEEKTSQELN